MRYLGPAFSRILAAWYNGPDHPARIRMFTALLNLLGNPRFTIPYAGTQYLTVDVADLVARTILTTGEYEPEVWHALAPCAPDSAVVWDVGGHIGSFSVRAAANKRVKEIHAFEPSPGLAEILRHTFALNHMNGVVHELALADFTGSVSFDVAPAANTGLGHIRAGPGRIKATTIDELVYSNGTAKPDLMKIDVEGSENAVLRGGARLFKTDPPKAIALEVEWHSGGPAPETVGLLEASGYSVSHIRRPDGHVEDRENLLAVTV